MPTIKPVSELQRNTAAIIKEAMETKEPIYLTKNGSAVAVVLDAAEYDRQLKVHQQLWRDYIKTITELGELQHSQDKGVPLDEVLQHLREKWGDDAY